MAFLWLMWFFLESDFTEEGCDENPFGPGVDYGLGVANQGVPQLEEMSHEEAARENVDTEAEKVFGEEKRKTRAKILEMDQAYLTERDTKRGKGRGGGNDESPAAFPRIRPSKHESDMDSTRSTPPPRPVGRGRGRGAALKYQVFEGSSPARHGSEGVVSRKPRPPTAHQLAVERNRSQRVEYILDKGLRKQHHRSRRLRRREGAIFLAYKRLQAQVDPFEDSDTDENGPRNIPKSDDKPTVFREAGLGGLSTLRSDPDDFGEEVTSYAAALRRSSRRLARWVGSDSGVVAPIRKHKAHGAATNGVNKPKSNGDANGDVTMDDIDMEGDQTLMAEDEAEATLMGEDDDVDPDRTEAMVDSDID
jgi:Ino eighty subunit 1